MARLTVWYNTRCPVCDAGIDRQRNKLIAAVQAGTIAFRDINLEPDALARFGASLEHVRRRLHATDEAGRLLVGADVAIAVWRLSPGEGLIATLLGNRAIRPLTRFVYDRFADGLYAWNRRKGNWEGADAVASGTEAAPHGFSCHDREHARQAE